MLIEMVFESSSLLYYKKKGWKRKIIEVWSRTLSQISSCSSICCLFHLYPHVARKQRWCYMFFINITFISIPSLILVKN